MSNYTQLDIDNGVIRKVTLSFNPPIPSFRFPQSNEILLNLGMQCWNSVFNAQGSRVIILVVHVGAVQALREKETQDETQFTTKIGRKTNLGPSHFLL
jgi:hypothetical protein